MDGFVLSSDGVSLSGSLSNAGDAFIGGGLRTRGSISCSDGVITVGQGRIAPAVCGVSVGDASTSSNSFLWHLGESGGPASRWELVGGDLTVTRIRTEDPATARHVTYALHIADDDAFEILQSTSNSVGASSHRRVARFGGPFNTHR